MRKILPLLMLPALAAASASADNAVFIVEGYSYSGSTELQAKVVSLDAPTEIADVASLSFTNDNNTTTINTSTGQVSLRATDSIILTPSDGVSISSVTVKTYRTISATAQGNLAATPEGGSFDFGTAYQFTWTAAQPAAEAVSFSGAALAVQYVEISYAKADEPVKTAAEFAFTESEVTLAYGETLPLPAWTPEEITLDQLSFSYAPNAEIAVIENGEISGLRVGRAFVTVNFAGNDTLLPGSFEDALVIVVEQADPGFEWQGLDENGSFTYDFADSSDAVSFPGLLNEGELTPFFASSNEDVASIDAATGDITPLGVGTTIISASVADNSNYFPVTYLLRVENNSAVSAVAIDAPARLTDIHGRPVSASQPLRGLYIRTNADGSSSKIFIK